MTQNNTQKGLTNGLSGHWALHCLVGLVLIIEISVLTPRIAREHPMARTPHSFFLLDEFSWRGWENQTFFHDILLFFLRRPKSFLSARLIQRCRDTAASLFLLRSQVQVLAAFPRRSFEEFLQRGPFTALHPLCIAWTCYKGFRFLASS